MVLILTIGIMHEAIANKQTDSCILQSFDDGILQLSAGAGETYAVVRMCFKQETDIACPPNK